MAAAARLDLRGLPLLLGGRPVPAARLPASGAPV